MTKEEIMKALGAEPEENTPKVNRREVLEANEEMTKQLMATLDIKDPQERFAKFANLLSAGMTDNPDLAEAMKSHAIQYVEFRPGIMERCHYGLAFSEKGYMSFGIYLSLSGVGICRHKSEKEEGLKLTPWTDGFSVEKLVALIDEKRKEFQKRYSDAVLIKEEVVADAIIKTMGVN